MIAIKGWPAQPSLMELASLLASQETQTRQMDGVTLKNEDEGLYD